MGWGGDGHCPNTARPGPARPGLSVRLAFLFFHFFEEEVKKLKNSWFLLTAARFRPSSVFLPRNWGKTVKNQKPGSSDKKQNKDSQDVLNVIQNSLKTIQNHAKKQTQVCLKCVSSKHKLKCVSSVSQVCLK